MIRAALAGGCLILLSACSGGTTPAAAPSASPTPISTPTSSAPASATPTRSATAAKVTASFASWRLPYRIAREGVTPLPGAAGSYLLAGGMLPDDTSTAQAVRIDPSTGSSQPLPPLPTPVHDVAAGAFGGLAAVFGGGNAAEQAVVQVFTGSRWRAAPPLPTSRSDLNVVSVPGATYVIGGYDGSATPRSILEVLPAGGFKVVGTLVEGVRYAATAVVAGSVYIFGGEVGGAELSAVQRFDPNTGRTTVVARLPRPLGHAVAVAVDGRVLLAGGRTDPNTQTAAMWWFDPATRRFSAAGKLPVATSDAALAGAGRSFWLLGGENPSVTDRVISLSFS